jgi:uncharacterized protein (TIGR00251 family)
MKEKDRRGMPPSGGHADISVRLTPRSSRDAVLGVENGVYRIKLTAPPVDGRANKALIAFLSKALRVPKRAISIVSGEKSRDKTLSIEGMTAGEVEKALFPHT